MKMTLRWYGPGYDSVTLEQIRQIPGVTGVITTLYDIPAGEEWPRERIKQLKAIVEEAGLKIEGIESVNVSDAIKIGTADRDRHIENYIRTLEHLGQEGIDLVCYNFMPVFDWTRTDLAKKRPDGSTVLAYDQKVVDSIDPQVFFNQTTDNSNGFVMPGWEPERLAHVKDLFEAYKDVDSDKLFANLVYFLEAIGPVCEKYGIKMGIHPDDPAWPVFGLPRIITGKEAILKLFKAVDKPYNGLTFCTWARWEAIRTSTSSTWSRHARDASTSPTSGTSTTSPPASSRRRPTSRATDRSTCTRSSRPCMTSASTARSAPTTAGRSGARSACPATASTTGLWAPSTSRASGRRSTRLKSAEYEGIRAERVQLGL